MEFSSERDHRRWLAKQAALPAGFRVGTTRCDFVPAEVGKAASMTLTLIAVDKPTADFAAVFTRNAFPGAPVRIGRQRLAAPGLGAIVVNNKVSNVCAPDGVAASERLCSEVGSRLRIPATSVLPSSTGIIGWRLPVEEMAAALPAAVSALQNETILPAAEGIMTTDLYPKVRHAVIGSGRVVGIAKGAGMIEPNLATMLVYILTDMAVPREMLRRQLPRAVADTFNAISVDSDQSTSDTVVLVSSGRHQCRDQEAFGNALHTVCAQLAEDIVRNGEGVKHVIRVAVNGAPDEIVARGVGKAVVNSPLFQCAVCGNDPNVGRLVCAVGDYLGTHHPELDPEHCRMRIGGHVVFEHGVFHLDPTLEATLSSYLKQAELYESAPPDEHGFFSPPIAWPSHERTVDVTIELGLGKSACTVTGADRSHEYISENADYRS